MALDLSDYEIKRREIQTPIQKEYIRHTPENQPGFQTRMPPIKDAIIYITAMSSFKIHRPPIHKCMEGPSMK